MSTATKLGKWKLPRCTFCKEYMEAGLFRVNWRSGRKRCAHAVCVGKALKHGQAVGTVWEEPLASEPPFRPRGDKRCWEIGRKVRGLKVG